MALNKTASFRQNDAMPREVVGRWRKALRMALFDQTLFCWPLRVSIGPDSRKLRCGEDRLGRVVLAWTLGPAGLDVCRVNRPLLLVVIRSSSVD